MDYQAAVKVYDKLVREKMAKGYTPGADGTPYQGTKREDVATGVFPQLLNSIDQAQAEQLASDDGWWMQEKFDGKRILIRKDGEQVVGINRKGLAVALPQPVVGQALAIGGRQWLMDGEAVGDIYIAFDLLDAAASTCGRSLTTCDWRPWATWCPGSPASFGWRTRPKTPPRNARNSPSAVPTIVKASCSSGSPAPYKRGRPSSGGDQLKLKFTATASCIVAKANGTKSAASLWNCSMAMHALRSGT